jgi:hypothetical protein
MWPGLMPLIQYYGGSSGYVPMTLRSDSLVPVQPTKPGAPPIYTETCCQQDITFSPTPSHYPFPSSTGTVDPEDPTGWLYNIYANISTFIGSQAVSSLYAPARIESVMQYCPHPKCGLSDASPVSAVGSAPGLLVTSTVHITSFTASSADTRTPSTKSTSPSVLVDPFSRSGSPSSQATKTPTTEQSSSAATASTKAGSASSTSETPTADPEYTTTPQAPSSSASPPPWYSRSTSPIHHRPTKTVTKAPPIEVGSAIFTPNSNTEYIVFSQTLRPGGPLITVSGTRLSLAPGATLLVEGSTTEVLTTKTGIGGYIWSGIGGSPTISTTVGAASASRSASAAPSVAPAQPGSASAQRIRITTVALLGITITVILIV